METTKNERMTGIYVCGGNNPDNRNAAPKTVTDENLDNDGTVTCPHCGLKLNRLYVLPESYCYMCGGKFKSVELSSSNEKLLLDTLAKNIPGHPSLFNSETEYGEPQHWVYLPNERSLEITYEDAGDDNRYYSWRVHCNDEEYENDDFHGTMGVMDQNTSDDLSIVTRRKLIAWAIKVALEKPVRAKTEEVENDEN